MPDNRETLHHFLYTPFFSSDQEVPKVTYTSQDISCFLPIVNQAFHKLRTTLALITSASGFLSEKYYSFFSPPEHLKLMHSLCEGAHQLRDCLASIDHLLPLENYITPTTLDFCLYFIAVVKQSLTVQVDNLCQRAESLTHTMDVLMTPPSHVMPLSPYEFRILMNFVDKEITYTKQIFNDLLEFFSWDELETTK